MVYISKENDNIDGCFKQMEMKTLSKSGHHSTHDSYNKWPAAFI